MSGKRLCYSMGPFSQINGINEETKRIFQIISILYGSALNQNQIRSIIIFAIFNLFNYPFAKKKDFETLKKRRSAELKTETLTCADFSSNEKTVKLNQIRLIKYIR